MKNVVVVGSQWGDEGKGKIVDWLSDQADVVVRFQGVEQYFLYLLDTPLQLLFYLLLHFSTIWVLKQKNQGMLKKTLS